MKHPWQQRRFRNSSISLAERNRRKDRVLALLRQMPEEKAREVAKQILIKARRMSAAKKVEMMSLEMLAQAVQSFEKAIANSNLDDNLVSDDTK